MIDVRVVAGDGSLSGVAKVEAALNPAGDGKIPKEPPPMAAVSNGSGLWTAKVPAAMPGPQELVVRLTDLAGNEAVTSHGKVRVVTPEELAAELAAKTNRVAGTAMYGEQGQAGIEVTLTNEAGQKIGPVRTNDQGAFEFPRVPVGKWKIAAQGLVRGAERVYPFDNTDKFVEVPAPPKLVPSLDLSLKQQRPKK
jgi:hypothetical protein